MTTSTSPQTVGDGTRESASGSCHARVTTRKDLGSDPCDGSDRGGFPRLGRSSSRRLRPSRGRVLRRLAYEQRQGRDRRGPQPHRLQGVWQPCPDWTVYVRLDTRGGPRAEYKLWDFEDLGAHSCGGRLTNGDPIKVRCGVLYDAPKGTGRRMLTWSVPRPHLTVNKPIRWWIHTHYQGDPDDSRDDRAPDTAGTRKPAPLSALAFGPWSDDGLRDLLLAVALGAGQASHRPDPRRPRRDRRRAAALRRRQRRRLGRRDRHADDVPGGTAQGGAAAGRDRRPCR